ncbi:MAG: NUDIX hydrolase [Prolixibacteraceae bacterium]|nr:NUDIX hydrolase [Prolixibacteraceae bacterium]
MYTYNYPRPALTVDAIVYVQRKNKSQPENKNISETYILLIRRGKEPFKNKWALPGGFVNMDELLEAACIRELEEETGIKVDKMSQFKTYDEIDRDPRHRTISVVFTAELLQQTNAVGGDDADQAEWFPISNLPRLAFDHEKIIDDFFSVLAK